MISKTEIDTIKKVATEIAISCCTCNAKSTKVDLVPWSKWYYKNEIISSETLNDLRALKPKTILESHLIQCSKCHDNYKDDNNKLRIVFPPEFFDKSVEAKTEACWLLPPLAANNACELPQCDENLPDYVNPISYRDNWLLGKWIQLSEYRLVKIIARIEPSFYVIREHWGDHFLIDESKLIGFPIMQKLSEERPFLR